MPCSGKCQAKLPRMEIFNNLQNKGLLLTAYGVIITLAGSEKQPCSISGALAQLVEQAFSCLSTLPILHRKAVNVKSAQNLARIFGAIAQLVARYIRIVEVRGSNPLSSTIFNQIRTVFHLRERRVRMYLPKRRYKKSWVLVHPAFSFPQK